MKVLSSNSTFFQALPSHFNVIYPGVELADILDKNVTHGAKTILVCESKSAAELVQLLKQQQYSHLVQFNSDFFLQDIEVAALVIDRPEMYFHGHAKVLIKESTKLSEIEFNHQDKKKDVFQKIDEFMSDIHPQNVKDSILSIAEELYMNAILDAPKEAQKKTSIHPYLKGEKAKMTLVQSDDRVVISCADPYGTLDMRKFISRLNDVYEQGAANAMIMKPGQGAGIGCMLMFENCDSLFLGVIPEKLTVVSCVIPLGLNNRRRAEIKKSLHLITI